LTAPSAVLIRPSPLGAISIGTAHALAAYAVFATLPALGASICALGIAISVGVHMGGALQWWRSSVHELRLQPDGGAAWRDGDGAWHVAHDVTGGALAPWLMVVGLKEAGRSLQPLLVLPDTLADRSRRELRIWLRWRPHIRRPAVIGVTWATGNAKDPKAS